ITSIKLTAADNTLGDFDGGRKAYNDNLKIIMVMDSFTTGTPELSATEEQEFFAEDGVTQLLSANVIDYRITAAPAVTGSAIEWTRWLNHKLSSTFGGAGMTAIDLSATHEFTSNAQLYAFFEGLDALDGTGAMANKNLLASLTLKLAAGNFGAASAYIGYTGSDSVNGLKSDIAITVHRNGARIGAGTESALVTVDYSDISTTGTESTVDNSNGATPTLASSASWLEYLTNTLTAADAAHTLDLTGGDFQLQPGTSITEAPALFNALQALNPTLKAKIDTIKIKLASGDHGNGALALSGTLDNAAGFTALARIIVDVTDAETDTPGEQKVVDLDLVTVEAAVKKVMWVNNLASVDFDSANATESWLAYVNYITRAGTAALDTSAINSGNGLTVPQLNKVFDALAAFSTANDNAGRLTGATAKLAAVAGSRTF
ncbi:MAG: hypothetical protein Q8R43_03430, partial [Alphaproteobacteria bacterium]|nr:hypothetical protein [Alphaproteobacteria bacterium]